MSDPDTLFDADALRVIGTWQEPLPEMTEGERLRHRQAARIATGYHPLAFGGMHIRLHPDAPRDAAKDDGRTYPRCGTCRFRRLMGGHSRDFPKCFVGYRERDLTEEEIGRNAGTWRQRATKWIDYGPRVTGSTATDVKGWWPACTDYTPKTDPEGAPS